ncbi:MAG: hypothetical protein KH828_05395 [Clostridiales bacterium]|nr:hypothetical protein [Clostridiales bacterium]
MKGIKKGLLAGVVLCVMPMLTACSFKETLGILWNSEDKKMDEEGNQTVDESTEGANIDENIEKPVIANEMGEPVTYGLNGQAEPLVVEASVTEGTLSYQWYRNTVDSNGGGTVIEGAVENTFTPATSEPGTNFYYVVVTNTVGEGIQLTTSGTKSVTVTEEPAVEEVPETVPAEEAAPQGSWQQSEQGLWYQYADGTYPTNKWEQIDGEWYVFDEQGYAKTGWYQEGEKWFYLNENGAMAHDTEVDGYQLGSDGVMLPKE